MNRVAFCPNLQSEPLFFNVSNRNEYRFTRNLIELNPRNYLDDSNQSFGRGVAGALSLGSPSAHGNDQRFL